MSNKLIGRTVQYYRDAGVTTSQAWKANPMAAIIVNVFDEAKGFVNLVTFSAYGELTPRLSVRFSQEPQPNTWCYLPGDGVTKAEKPKK